VAALIGSIAEPVHGEHRGQGKQQRDKHSGQLETQTTDHVQHAVYKYTKQNCCTRVQA
jgi:hypothetical protein